MEDCSDFKDAKTENIIRRHDNSMLGTIGDFIDRLLIAGIGAGVMLIFRTRAALH